MSWDVTDDDRNDDVDAAIERILRGDEFDRITEGVELAVPEGACPNCFRKLVYLNRVRVCMGCGFHEPRGTRR